MKKPLLIAATVLVLAALYYFWLYKLKEEPAKADAVQQDSLSANTDVPVSTATDSSKMIMVNYEDLSEEKMDEYRQKGYLSQGKYLSEEYFDKLKEYIVSSLIDTTPLKTYIDYGHLKQRYFFFVYNNLPEFVDKKERHTGYYVEANGLEDNDSKFLAYGIYRIDRSPQNIRKTFEFFKPHLTEYVNKELYSKLAIGRSIHSLLDTYAYLQKLERSGAKMDSIYAKVDSVAQHYDYAAPSAYGHSLDSDYGIYDKYLQVEKYDLANPDSAYNSLWAFSFWVRRHHEKNEEEVYKILKEIREIFEVEN